MYFNYSRAKEMMENYKLDALIATSPENVNYCSDLDYTSLYRYKYGRLQTFVIIPKDENIEPVIIIPIDILPYIIDKRSWINDIRTYGTFYIYGMDLKNENYSDSEIELSRLWEKKNEINVFAALSKVLREKKLDKNLRIGIDETNIICTSTWEKLYSEFPKLELIRALGIFKEIRMVKTSSEIAMLTKSIEINDRALEAAINMIEVGTTEKEFFQYYKNFVVGQGALHGFSTTGAGTRGGALFPPSRYAIKKGDLVRVDSGCIFNRYWSDTARTVAINIVSEKAKKYYNAIYSGIKEGAQLLKPGAKVSEVFDKIVSTVKKCGISHYQRHHCGHSMGLETYEPPMIVPSDKPSSSDIFLHDVGEIRIEKNMIINLEAPYYEIGFGGLQFEETYLITEDGAKVLTSLNQDVYFV